MFDNSPVTTVNSAYIEDIICNYVSNVSPDVFWVFKELTLYTNYIKKTKTTVMFMFW